MLEQLFSLDLSLSQWVLFIVAGIATGIINTLAGSGSLITLPIFIFMCGLPADVANGTNRVGALIQSGVGTYSFRRSGFVEWKGTVYLIIPSIAGAILGAWLASGMSARTMNGVIAGLMVVMLGVLLINPKRWLRESDASAANNRKPLNLLVFFVIGVYGGFIQAGVGILLTAALVLLARYSLSATAGIKLLIVFLFSIPSLFIFFQSGLVHLGFGLVMAVCQSVGALIGVRFATRVPKANQWIHRLLILIVIVSAMKFLGVFDYL